MARKVKVGTVAEAVALAEAEAEAEAEKLEVEKMLGRRRSGEASCAPKLVVKADRERWQPSWHSSVCLCPRLPLDIPFTLLNRPLFFPLPIYLHQPHKYWVHPANRVYVVLTCVYIVCYIRDYFANLLVRIYASFNSTTRVATYTVFVKVYISYGIQLTFNDILSGVGVI